MPNEYKEVELVYTVYRAAKIPKDAVVKFSHYGILYYTHQGKTYKTRTMEPGCDYKTHEKLCVNELDTDEEPDEEPDEVDENEARQDSDSDEDTDEDASDESEDESEENNKCDNKCGCVLSSDVHIFCWEKGDEKLTVCSECYLRYRYWWDDENPENENVIREHKDI